MTRRVWHGRICVFCVRISGKPWKLLDHPYGIHVDIGWQWYLGISVFSKISRWKIKMFCFSSSDAPRGKVASTPMLGTTNNHLGVTTSLSRADLCFCVMMMSKSIGWCFTLCYCIDVPSSRVMWCGNILFFKIMRKCSQKVVCYGTDRTDVSRGKVSWMLMLETTSNRLGEVRGLSRADLWICIMMNPKYTARCYFFTKHRV